MPELLLVQLHGGLQVQQLPGLGVHIASSILQKLLSLALPLISFCALLLQPLPLLCGPGLSFLNEQINKNVSTSLNKH